MATTFQRIMPSGSATGTPISVTGTGTGDANEVHIVATSGNHSTEIRCEVFNGHTDIVTVTLFFDQATDQTVARDLAAGESWSPDPFSLTGTVTLKVYASAGAGAVKLSPRVTTLTVA
jgi:hypothetical protein